MVYNGKSQSEMDDLVVALTKKGNLRINSERSQKSLEILNHLIRRCFLDPVSGFIHSEIGYMVMSQSSPKPQGCWSWPFWMYQLPSGYVKIAIENGPEIRSEISYQKIVIFRSFFVCLPEGKSY